MLAQRVVPAHPAGADDEDVPRLRPVGGQALPCGYGVELCGGYGAVLRDVLESRRMERRAAGAHCEGVERDILRLSPAGEVEEDASGCYAFLRGLLDAEDCGGRGSDDFVVVLR